MERTCRTWLEYHSSSGRRSPRDRGEDQESDWAARRRCRTVWRGGCGQANRRDPWASMAITTVMKGGWTRHCHFVVIPEDRKSTRLNSSHVEISYAAVFLYT